MIMTNWLGRTMRCGLLASLALLSPSARGQAETRPNVTRVDGRLNADAVESLPNHGVGKALAKHYDRKGSTVPPSLEIEILDPNVDPNGNPAVIVDRESGGPVKVTIPPVVLVHRFYYTGDRSFQGPMLPGGPSILVVNHPANGERLYLEVQMLPGAPRVIYTRHSIDYNYGPQGITLKFGLHGKPEVVYRHGTPVVVKARAATNEVAVATVKLVKRTGLTEASRKVAAGTKNIVVTSADRVHDVGKAIVSPIAAAIKATPLANVLTSSAEERATKERDNAVQQSQAEVDRLDQTINTVRGN